MGLEDRDWYREEMRKREATNQRKRQLNQFRHAWIPMVVQTLVYCLAVFGAFSLLARFIL